MTPSLVRTAKPALTGRHPGIWGDCSRLSGDLDDCGLTDEDRAKGVDIASLIAS